MQNFCFLIIVSVFIPDSVSSVGTSGMIELVKLDNYLVFRKLS